MNLFFHLGYWFDEKYKFKSVKILVIFCWMWRIALSMKYFIIQNVLNKVKQIFVIQN